jgi:FemAB-related protein (PEP-CTERM system-associated)
MSNLRVRKVEIRESAQWDGFVEAHPGASPFHLSAWRRTIESVFGYRAHYLVCEREEAWTAVLPLFLVKNPVIGKALISTPFAVYGGVLALDEASKAAVADAVRALGCELGVDYVDIRNEREEQRLGFSGIDRYVTFTQPVSPGDLESLLETIPKKTRNMVRKAHKTDFEVRHAVREWRPFEKLHSFTLRRLGTPSFPPRLFEAIIREFGERAEICELRLEGALAAASLCFVFGGSTHIYYACTDPAFNHLAVNYRMYSEQLQRAGNRGCATFDFGRSKLGTGTLEFKKHWATEMRALPYEMLLVRRKELPDFTPKNPAFSLPIEVWKRLPLWLTRAVGPHLVKLFP